MCSSFPFALRWIRTGVFGEESTTEAGLVMPAERFLWCQELLVPGAVLRPLPWLDPCTTLVRPHLKVGQLLLHLNITSFILPNANLSS